MLLSRTCLFSAAACFWIVAQLSYLSDHSPHEHIGDPYFFANNFEFIIFERTNLHEKGLKHWYEWLEANGHWLPHQHEPLTLLHFDIHAHDDVIDDEVDECAPGQFFQYDLMVREILELTEDRIDNTINISQAGNITEELSKVGYYSTVVWIYPDHWLNYSETVVFDVNYKLYQQYTRFQTYYVTPVGGLEHKYSFLKNDQYPSEMHEFWDNYIFKHNIDLVDHELDAAHSVRVDIIALPLSEMLNNSHLLRGPHFVVLDLDLDFFSCQNIAENMMERFEWNQSLIDDLNLLLSHHQYMPHHMPYDLYEHAMISLMYLTLQKQSIPNENHLVNNISSEAIPTIADILRTVMEEEKNSDVSIWELKQALQFVYRLQLEVGVEKEPMQSFVSAHKYLDQLLLEMDLSDQLHDIMQKWSAEEWHQHLADILAVNVSAASEMSASTVNIDGSTTQTVSNFEEQIMPHLLHALGDRHFGESNNETSDHDGYADWITFSSIADHPPKSAEQILEIAALLHSLLDSSEHQHKISVPLIHGYLNQTSNATTSSSSNTFDANDLQNLMNLVEQQPTKLYYPDHDWFHDKIRLKRNKMEFERNIEDEFVHVSYPQLLGTLDFDPSYRYHDWAEILERNKQENWTKSYLSEESKLIVEDGPKKRSFNESNRNITTHDIDSLIGWNTLDDIQQHFLSRSDHRAMQRFMDKLTPKQTLFLKWLLFCYFRSTVCEEGHHPFQLVANQEIASQIFGEKFPWDELMRIPAFTESLRHELRGILQLEFVSNGQRQRWTPRQSHEQYHLPPSQQIKHALHTISAFLSLSNIFVVTGGLELSRGHVPMRRQLWLECMVMKTLSAALHQNGSDVKITLVRYQNFFDNDLNIDQDVCAKYNTPPSCLNHITSVYI